MRTLLIIVAAGGSVAACSESEPARDIAPFADASVREDGGVVPSLSFRCSLVDGENTTDVVGFNAVLGLDANDRPTIAYSAETSEAVIRYAYQDANGDWTSEDVVRPGGDVIGLGFAQVGGVPHVAYIGGDDDGRVTTPYPTDLMLSTRDGSPWRERTLVDVSNEAMAVCPDVDDYCNFGHVVGTYAAIAATGGSFMVAYRDVHGGFGMDDRGRSDVEVYAEGLQPAQSVADPGRSGGPHLSIGLTADNRPVLAYYLERPQPGENRVGVWSAVWRGSEWAVTKVSDSQTTHRTSVAAAPDGTLYIAFFDSTNDDLVLATSVDDGDSWARQTIESAGKVGLYPSLTLDAMDQPMVAYTYCGRTTEGSCPGTLGSDAEVRLARYNGEGWDITPVDDGQGRGGVGLYNSMAVAADGTIYVVFQDARNGDLLIAEATP